ncbi:MAG: DUF4010 domain-containing protein, partial [Myxococcales bacterium]|nr:DUF4010 domain-containing protein [Myxococcales bacterium]
LRVGVVVGIFNLPLALDLALPLALLSLAGAGFAALCLWLGRRGERSEPVEVPQPGNPLELPSAVIFAVLFVLISVLSTWVEEHFGHVGIYSLAAIVGVTDIDPFVLSVAQGGVAHVDRTVIAIAIVIAASSNDVLKAVYSAVFAGWRRSVGAVASLVVLGLLGYAIAGWLAYGARLV